MFLHPLIIPWVLGGPNWKSWILPHVSILLEIRKKESKVVVSGLYLQHWLQLLRLYQVLLLHA